MVCKKRMKKNSTRSLRCRHLNNNRRIKRAVKNATKNSSLRVVPRGPTDCVVCHKMMEIIQINKNICL